MNVSLTDELERWIEARVSSGLYRSSSEVVREALRLLREREDLKEIQREKLRQLIRRGVEDLDAGRSTELTDDLVDAIKVEERKRRARNT